MGVDSLRSSLCVKKVRGLRECSALRELQVPHVCVCVNTLAALVWKRVRVCLLYDCACVSRRTLVTQARWPGWSPTGGAITEVVTGSDWLGRRGEQWQRPRAWVKPARGPSYGSGLCWLRRIAGPAWTWAAQAFQFLRSVELVHV